FPDYKIIIITPAMLWKMTAQFVSDEHETLTMFYGDAKNSLLLQKSNNQVDKLFPVKFSLTRGFYS
ncbi:hypothetical protein L9F63_019503, partial [Diploptera punctata]